MQAGHEELPGGFHGLTNNCRCFWLSATLTSAAKESQFTVRRKPRVFPLRTYNNVRSGAPNKNIVQNHLNVELLNVF